MMNYEPLKTRHRAEREEWPENLGLRVHWALSWLDRMEPLGQQYKNVQHDPPRE